MQGRWLSVGLVLVAALAGWLWRGPGAEPGAQRPPDAAIAALETALTQERAAREALAAEVQSLRAELAHVPALPPAPTAAEPAHPRPPEPPPPPPDAPPAGGVAAFDAQVLVEAGFDEREAQRLRERSERLELDRLYLRDRAVREGWASTQRFRDELRGLDAQGQALRDELGDERYDWLLFASGASNRVVVATVMERSPAGEAGIQPGDAIVRYGDARLFDARTLRDATTEGRAGETVPVEISRDGAVLRLFVPRGPLGVRLDESRVKPEAKIRG